MEEKGNVTVYEHRTGESPKSVEELTLEFSRLEEDEMEADESKADEVSTRIKLFYSHVIYKRNWYVHMQIRQLSNNVTNSSPNNLKFKFKVESWNFEMINSAVLWKSNISFWFYQVLESECKLNSNCAFFTIASTIWKSCFADRLGSNRLWYW